jgi:hypothetical protein
MTSAICGPSSIGPTSDDFVWTRSNARSLRELGLHELVWTAEVQDAWTLAYNVGTATLLAAGNGWVPYTALSKSMIRQQEPR